MATPRATRMRALAAALIVALVPACSGEGDPAAETTSPIVTAPESDTSSDSALAAPTSTPTSTSTPTQPATSSAEDEAAAEAIAALESFIAVLDEITADSTRPLDELDEFATDEALSWARDSVRDVRDREWTVEGTRVLDEVTVTNVQLDTDGRPTVSVDTCIDISNFVAFDRDGNSVVAPGRPESLLIDWDMWRIDGTWTVAETGFRTDSPEVRTCES